MQDIYLIDWNPHLKSEGSSPTPGALLMLFFIIIK